MLPKPLRLANELLAFLLELVAFALLGMWGWHAGGNTAVRVVLAVLFPAAAITLWGLFAAPRARIPVSLPWVLVVKAAVFGAATAAAAVTVGASFAVACGVVFVVNTALATSDRESLIRQSRDAAGPAARD